MNENSYKDSLKITVLGDFRAANVSKIIVDEKIRTVLKSSDIAICNFEAPISGYGKSISKSGPILCQSEESPRFLLNLGFNAILLANNHIMDYGEEGCRATIDAFAGVTTVGVGRGKDAFRLKTFELRGVRVGLLSFVQREFGAISSNDEEMGAAWICDPAIPKAITEARCVVDYLFVFPHAGVEHTDAPLPEWREIYKNMIDCGADFVIASHPHCPQGWEYYKGHPIFYSLGDFYFDELTNDHFWYKSLMVEIEIGRKLDMKVSNIEFNRDGRIAYDNSEIIKNHTRYLNDLLCDRERYDKYVLEMCLHHYNGLRYGILRGVCGTSLKVGFKWFLRLLCCVILNNEDSMQLLNSLQCESHRWVMERYLRMNKKQLI